MKITLDEGFLFGIGLFETIAVENGHGIFLREHLKRLEQSAHFLGVATLRERGITVEKIQEHIAQKVKEHGVLKIILSQENFILQTRENPYTKEHYRRGFVMDFSEVRRNETSPLTYHKTMNYGDCILEKRNASKAGMDERIFLNTRGQLCEGTISNIFFVKGRTICTPALECGMLPGILRDYVCRLTDADTTILYPEELGEFDECFVTNSLMGIMPVHRLGEFVFTKHTITEKISAAYLEERKH